MISGALTVLTLYTIGIANWFPQIPIGAQTSFRPYYLLGFDPLLWGLLIAAALGIFSTMLTDPPDKDHVSRKFDVIE